MGVVAVSLGEEIRSFQHISEQKWWQVARNTTTQLLHTLQTELTSGSGKSHGGKLVVGETPQYSSLSSLEEDALHVEAK